jgi:N-acetylmuramoyl-L-alanine amidase
MRRIALAGLQVVSLTVFFGLCAHAEDKPPASNQPSAAADDTCKRASFKVLIDVGHTPDDPGAISAHGNPEYGFNLSLANVTTASLIDAGFRHTTLLLAKGKSYAQLVQRAAIANRVAPDLLLSIHHDSVPPVYLRKWEFAGVERPYSDKFSGHSLFVSHKNRFYRQSVDFAKLLGRELAAANLRFNPQHAEDIPGARHPLIDAELGVYSYDNLVVLKDIAVPAVLFEAGSIINRQEELVMRTPERQALLAKAITSAVVEFCNGRKEGPSARETPAARARKRSE